LPIRISAYVDHLQESGIRFHELRVQRSHENISRRTQTLLGFKSSYKSISIFTLAAVSKSQLFAALAYSR
jgi:hypothetical protein